MRMFCKRRYLIIGAIILLCIPTVNIFAEENYDYKKNVETIGENNLLATVDITHYIFRDNFAIMDIEITPADNREYNFTEIDDIVEMNFTIILNHRLYRDNVKNRNTLLLLEIEDSGGLYISDLESFPCNSTDTITDYFYVDNVNKVCYTNGTNKTLNVSIYIKAYLGPIQWPPGRTFWYGAVHYPFPFRWLNCLLYVEDSEFDIKIIPIPV